MNDNYGTYQYRLHDVDVPASLSLDAPRTNKPTFSNAPYLRSPTPRPQLTTATAMQARRPTSGYL